ncbi:hypothetical protein E1262_17245 [Jiangella aurantiaca]|uniref:Uncharacterized protein n=1 Tax=Jiangella aurantiaca TaxID=2530373 RepID=A0A4R5A751_9ACTN|nr:hypothetical protein [Jiangella aurantiaca]TDD67958.1 hypothetical protein E1262_17245 [Jiangella aurantiaca]
MTTSADGDGVRHAAESLRAANDALPDIAGRVDDRIRGVVERAAADIERAAHAVQGSVRGELLESAHEIRLIGTRMTAAREDAFSEVAHVLTGYADEIAALLRATGSGSGVRLTDISVDPLPEPPPSTVTSAQETAVIAQNVPDADAHRRAIDAVVACCPVEYQPLMRDLLTGQSAHAIERHGHHLTPVQMVARLQWLLDPASVDGWRLNADGSADSWRQRRRGTHQVGTSSGYYTSPEAFAKPFLALLRAAGLNRAELDTYLDSKAAGETIIKVFLRTSDTGVTAQDVYTQRAPGTDTRDGKKMWKRARRGAMAGHGEMPGVREHDMVKRGKRPGSLIVLAKGQDESWRLITSYFADDPHRVDYMEL